MSEEDIVQEYYGFREFVQFDVDVAYDLTTDELATTFREGCEFLHYIGYVDERGFRCQDGLLNARELDEVNVESFLLNACRSFKQGAALVERGSLGGLVTLANVLNAPAVQMGRVLARTLNSGFSLQSALDVARQRTAFGNQYILIGDVTLQLVKSAMGNRLSANSLPSRWPGAACVIDVPDCAARDGLDGNAAREGELDAVSELGGAGRVRGDCGTASRLPELRESSFGG